MRYVHQLGFLLVLLVLLADLQANAEEGQRTAGWFLRLSPDPLKSCLEDPGGVTSDLVFVPESTSEWVVARRPVLLAAASDERVAPSIRLKILRFLILSGKPKQGNAVATTDELLKFESQRYAILEHANFGQSQRLLAICILQFDLPREPIACEKTLKEARWKVQLDDIAYCLSNIVPNVTVKK